MKLRLLLFGMLFLSAGLFTNLKAQGETANIEEYVSTYIKNHYSQPSLRFDVELKWIPRSLKGVLPDEIISMKYRGTNKIPRGYEIFHLKVKGKTGRVYSERIQAFIAVERKLLVATHRILREEAITDQNAHTAWVDVTQNNRDWISSLEAVNGQVAKTIINAGTPITRQNTQRTPVVFAGDMIELWYQPGNFRIQLNCTARQPGAVGDKVRLFSEETGRMYIGEIINQSTAIWKSTL